MSCQKLTSRGIAGQLHACLECAGTIAAVPVGELSSFLALNCGWVCLLLLLLHRGL